MYIKFSYFFLIAVDFFFNFDALTYYECMEKRARVRAWMGRLVLRWKKREINV